MLTVSFSLKLNIFKGTDIKHENHRSPNVKLYIHKSYDIKNNMPESNDTKLYICKGNAHKRAGHLQ